MVNLMISSFSIFYEIVFSLHFLITYTHLFDHMVWALSFTGSPSKLQHGSSLHGALPSEDAPDSCFDGSLLLAPESLYRGLDGEKKHQSNPDLIG
jgi:hypothetical protein